MKFEKLDISTIDLNNLNLLSRIAQTGALARAAAQMGMSQSTASYNLDKMRQAFQDPLFYRHGRGLRPTQKGDALVELADDMLTRIRAIDLGPEFDAATANHRFVIGCTVYEAQSFLGTAIAKMVEEAPGITVELKSTVGVAIDENLQGDWDLAVSALLPETSGLRTERLYNDGYATFYDPEVRSAPESLEDFITSPHIVAQFGDNEETIVDGLLRKQGLYRQIKVTTPGFDMLGFVMKGSPLITTLPKRFGQGLLKDFAWCDCPLIMGQMATYLAWNRGKDNEPAHKWLREQLLRAAQTDRLQDE